MGFGHSTACICNCSNICMGVFVIDARGLIRNLGGIDEKTIRADRFERRCRRFSNDTHEGPIEKKKKNLAARIRMREQDERRD
mgnify:CR=1 FL=1